MIPLDPYIITFQTRDYEQVYGYALVYSSSHTAAVDAFCRTLPGTSTICPDDCSARRIFPEARTAGSVTLMGRYSL
jgi:hypothetical protein